MVVIIGIVVEIIVLIIFDFYLSFFPPSASTGGDHTYCIVTNGL